MPAAAAVEPSAVTYYDPWASGDSGPHLRYPAQEDGSPTRQYLTFYKGAIDVVEGSTEERMVRTYLENRGFKPDRFKGNNLDEPLRCRCGVLIGNLVAAAAHKKRWPDHDLEFMDL